VTGICTPSCGEQPCPVAATHAGTVIGSLSSDGTVAAFLGVPFAQPPVGPLRFAPPIDVAPWTGARLATTFGAVCPQAFGTQNDYSGQAEDCLTLNIWTPVDTTTPRSVLVYIHGGHFKYGTTSSVVYNGEALAARGVVVVSIDYRVGVLGFFSHPDLVADGSAGGWTPGNFGLRDQLLGLEWVNRNIAQFGGDPDRVTIMGSSAGGASVAYLMAAPPVGSAPGGLFRGVIMESGGGRGGQSRERCVGRAARRGEVLTRALVDGIRDRLALDPPEVTSCYAAAVGFNGLPQVFNSVLPCVDAATDYDELAPVCRRELLHGASWKDLLRAELLVGCRIAAGVVTAVGYWDPAPCVDDELVTAPTTGATGAPFMDHVAAGTARPVPLLVGSNGYEASVAPDVVTTNPRNYLDNLVGGGRFDELARVYQMCPASMAPDDRVLRRLARTVYADSTFAVPARRLARLHAQHGHAAYVYFFNYVSAFEREHGLNTVGAKHTGLNPFSFGTFFTMPEFTASFPATETDRAVGATVQDLWLGFVTGTSGALLTSTHDPTIWSPRPAEGENTLIVGYTGTIREDVYAVNRHAYLESLLFNDASLTYTVPATCP